MLRAAYFEQAQTRADEAWRMWHEANQKAGPDAGWAKKA